MSEYPHAADCASLTNQPEQMSARALESGAEYEVIDESKCSCHVRRIAELELQLEELQNSDIGELNKTRVRQLHEKAARIAELEKDCKRKNEAMSSMLACSVPKTELEVARASCVEKDKRIAELERELQMAQIARDKEFWREYADSSVRAIRESNGKLVARIAELEQEVGLSCTGCGMVYPGKPSTEPWACDKCLEETRDHEQIKELEQELVKRDQVWLSELPRVTYSDAKWRQVCAELEQEYERLRKALAYADHNLASCKMLNWSAEARVHVWNAHQAIKEALNPEAK